MTDKQMQERHQAYMNRRIKELREEQGIEPAPSNKELHDIIKDIKIDIANLKKIVGDIRDKYE